jgi:hypothetical protein
LKKKEEVEIVLSRSKSISFFELLCIRNVGNLIIILLLVTANDIVQKGVMKRLSSSGNN